MTAFIKSSLIQSYNHHAEERSNKTELESWKIEERSVFLQALREDGKSGLLEIGAVPGRDSLFFMEQGFRVTCTDLSPEMVRICRERGLDAHVMDFFRLDFAEATFDAVYALNCLLHVTKSEIDGVLQEIRRVMKPNGLLYMGVYGGQDFEGIWEQDHYEPKRFFSFHTDEQMRELVERYFHIHIFNVVNYQPEGLHFQSMILRKSDR